MSPPVITPATYSSEVKDSFGVAIGDGAHIIQHIGAVYNISQSGPTRITASLKGSLNPLLREYDLFGGRDQELKQLNDFIAQKNKGYFFVTGDSGFGKSALLVNWLNQLQNPDHLVCYHFIHRQGGVVSERVASESFTLENLCEQLANCHNLYGTLPGSVDRLRALYPLLLQIPPEEGKRIIVVLDGLDEAIDWAAGADLFPHNLSEGVFIIFSARTLPSQDWIGKLRLPKSTEILRLDRLGIIEIADLLRKASETTKPLADDGKFVADVYNVSHGDPFYLGFLVEDIINGRITAANIGTTPVGLNDYLKEWWEQLSRDINIKVEEVYELLGILAVARGRLRLSDFDHISPKLSKGALLTTELDGKLRRYLTGDGNSGYAISHYRFTKYLREELFNENEIHAYRQQLLDYCRHWQKFKSQYALNHYAAHLAESVLENPRSPTRPLSLENSGSEVDYQEELYALINESWLQVQFTRFYSHHAFANDVELAIKVATSETAPDLMQTVRNCLIYATLGSLATKVPPEILGVMARVGQVERARGYASLIQEPQQQVQAGLAIYEAILIRQASAEEQTETKAVLALALAAAEKLDDPVMKARTLSSIAQTLVRFNDRPHAAEITDNAERIAQTITNKFAQERTLSSIAQTRTQIEQFDRAMKIVVAFADETTKGSALTSLVHRLNRPEDLESVLEASVKLEEQVTQINVLNSVTQGFARCNDIPRATELAHRAWEIWQAITSEAAKAIAFNLVAQTFAWAKDVTGLLTIVQTIQDHLVKGEALSAAAQIFVQNGERENAVRIAEDACLEMQFVEDQQTKAGVLSNVAQTLAHAGALPRASAIADEIVDKSSKSLAIIGIVQALTQQKLFDDAIMQLGKIDDDRLIAPVLTTIASAYALDKQPKRALAIVDIIKGEPAKLDALSEVAQALAQAGEIQQAIEIMNRAVLIMDAIKPEHSKVIALSSVAQALVQNNELEKAVVVATCAREVARLIEDEGKKGPALSSVARTLVLARQFDLALTTIQEIDDEEAKALALSSIAQTLAEMGEREQASSFANLALAGAADLQDKWSKAVVLSDTAQTLLALGDSTQATGLVNRAYQDAQEVKDAQLKPSAVSSVVQTMVLLQQVDPAAVASEAIQAELANEWVLGDIAQALAKVGKWQDAEEKVEQIKDISYKVQTLSSVAQALAKLGETEKAAEFAKAALELLEKIADDRVTAQSLRTLPQALGFVQEVEVLEQAHSLAERMVAEGARVWGLSAVAQAYMTAHQPQQALKVVMGAFSTARLTGRDLVFQALEGSATTLANLQDQNQNAYLWQTYEKLAEVERWWQIPQYHPLTK